MRMVNLSFALSVTGTYRLLFCGCWTPFVGAHMQDDASTGCVWMAPRNKCKKSTKKEEKQND